MRDELKFTTTKDVITRCLGRDVFSSCLQRAFWAIKGQEQNILAYNPKSPFERVFTHQRKQGTRLEICATLNGRTHSLLSANFNHRMFFPDVEVNFQLKGTGVSIPDCQDIEALLREVGNFMRHVPNAIHYDKFYRELIEHLGAEPNDALINDLPEDLQDAIKQTGWSPDSTCE